MQLKKAPDELSGAFLINNKLCFGLLFGVFNTEKVLKEVKNLLEVGHDFCPNFLKSIKIHCCILLV